MEESCRRWVVGDVGVEGLGFGVRSNTVTLL